MRKEVNELTSSAGARFWLWRSVNAVWWALGAVGKNHRLSVLTIFTLTLVASAVPSLIGGNFPIPEVHDEFCNLLAGDTFANGRLTNPTHPMWESFETFYVMHQPTYQSKYPPAQAVFLAIGQILTGQPIVGVWLSAALMCAAVCWMLQAWIPGRWALIGALFLCLRTVVSNRAYADGQLAYWSQSYWGGAVAALGGALVYGGLRRIIRQPRVEPAILCALGLAVLANSRPYEGLVAVLPAAILLAVWFVTRAPSEMISAAKLVVVPIMVILLAAGAMLAAYNHSVTGSATVMPYMHYTSTYGVCPIFVWQQPSEIPEYRTEAMRDLHVDWELNQGYDPDRTLRQFAIESFLRGFNDLRFLLGSLLGVATLVMFPWILRDRWNQFAVAVCATQLIGSSFTSYFHFHYAAPMTSLVFLISMQGLRRWSVLTLRGWPIGRLFVIALFVTMSFLVARVWQQESTGPPREERVWAMERTGIVNRLTNDGEKHLIIVRYGPQHDVHRELVFNSADIDNAPIVWAREMDDAQNERLLQYFHDRRVWLLYVDSDVAPMELASYAPAE